MKEFIKSIFTTPVNLWTIGQELFVMGFCIVALLLVYGLIWLICVLVERIKYKGCSLRKSIPSQCNGNCKECSFAKFRNKKSK